jgi:hypothetical protein
MRLDLPIPWFSSSALQRLGTPAPPPPASGHTGFPVAEVRYPSPSDGGLQPLLPPLSFSPRGTGNPLLISGSGERCLSCAFPNERMMVTLGSPEAAPGGSFSGASLGEGGGKALILQGGACV